MLRLVLRTQPRSDLECALDFPSLRRHKRSMKSTRLTALIVALCLHTVRAEYQPEFLSKNKSTAPRIDVILWFDTEDYLLPADDDAAKRLAECTWRHLAQAIAASSNAVKIGWREARTRTARRRDRDSERAITSRSRPIILFEPRSCPSRSTHR